jgi:hypothetical protein
LMKAVRESATQSSTLHSAIPKKNACSAVDKQQAVWYY